MVCNAIYTIKKQMQLILFLVKKKKVVPPPRSVGTIEVTFSPRVFSTPSRESKAPEEEEVDGLCKLKYCSSLLVIVWSNGHSAKMQMKFCI